jgi:hypothetical protein
MEFGKLLWLDGLTWRKTRENNEAKEKFPPYLPD